MCFKHNMMKFYIVITVVIICLFHLARSQEDIPQKCRVPNSTAVIEQGDSYTTGNCIKYICQETGNGIGLTGVTCPAIVIEDGCYLSKIESGKSYPFCCPKKICL